MGTTTTRRPPLVALLVLLALLTGACGDDGNDLAVEDGVEDADEDDAVLEGDPGEEEVVEDEFLEEAGEEEPADDIPPPGAREVFDEIDLLGDDDDFDALDDEALVGERITLTAAVDAVVEPDRSFIVGEDLVDGGYLVLVPPSVEIIGTPPTLSEGVGVQVTGTVTEVVIADVERAFGLTLDEELYVTWLDRPGLVAESVEILYSQDQLDDEE